MANYKRKKRRGYVKDPGIDINEMIKNPQLRVITEDGQMVGVLTIDEALAKADELDVDLVMINPKAEPAVAKLIDYSKFKYLQDKALKNKPKSKNELKTLRVSVRISGHDLKRIYAKKTEEFLNDGIKVKLQVQMRGREKQHPEVAKEVMDQFLEAIDIDFSFEAEPKLVGDSVYATLKPPK